jgi:hypothetical protein
MSSEDAADYLNEMTQVQLRIFAVRIPFRRWQSQWSRKRELSSA